MAVGTQKREVLEAVVFAVPVDVMELEGDSAAAPVLESALLTTGRQ
jgi:hypothetical protein